MDPLPWKSNYFAGPRESWRVGVRNYERVSYTNVYPAIDLDYRWHAARLEYDWTVQPGGDPSQIRMRFRGVKQARVSAAGTLLFRTPLGMIEHGKPVAYQVLKGTKHGVDAAFVLGPHGDVAFRLGPYDRHLPLVIDPTIVFAALIGATASSAQTQDAGVPSGVTTDTSGNVYASVIAYGPDFPTTGSFGPNAPGTGVHVIKLDPSGSKLLFSTFLGGVTSDHGSLVADGSGLYLVGEAASGFPTTSGAFQTTPKGAWDAFVAKLSLDGTSLIYSTFLGGSDYDYGDRIAVDALGNAFLFGATLSSDFPRTAGTLPYACGGSGSNYIAKLNPQGSGLVYALCLPPVDRQGGIAVDQTGAVFVAGDTNSSSFPTTAGAFQTQLSGVSDAVVFKLNPTGSAFIYSTYLGGSGLEFARGIAIDSAGNAYIAGTTSSADFPTRNPIQSRLVVFQLNSPK